MKHQMTNWQHNCILKPTLAIQYKKKLMIMASILALSMIWMSNCCSHSLAWSPPRMPYAKSSTHLTHQHTCITHHSPMSSPTVLLSSSVQEDITVDVDAKLLQELTIPELKERLRSNGQKVCSCDVCTWCVHVMFAITHITYTINVWSDISLYNTVSYFRLQERSQS